MPLSEGQEFLSADWISRIYASFVMHPEAESVFDACYGIPTQYMDDAEDLWERLKKNAKERPLPEGSVHFIPGEFEI